MSLDLHDAVDILTSVCVAVATALTAWIAKQQLDSTRKMREIMDAQKVLQSKQLEDFQQQSSILKEQLDSLEVRNQLQTVESNWRAITVCTDRYNALRKDRIDTSISIKRTLAKYGTASTAEKRGIVEQVRNLLEEHHRKFWTTMFIQGQYYTNGIILPRMFYHWFRRLVRRMSNPDDDGPIIWDARPDDGPSNVMTADALRQLIGTFQEMDVFLSYKRSYEYLVSGTTSRLGGQADETGGEFGGSAIETMLREYFSWQQENPAARHSDFSFDDFMERIDGRKNDSIIAKPQP